MREVMYLCTFYLKVKISQVFIYFFKIYCIFYRCLNCCFFIRKYKYIKKLNIQSVIFNNTNYNN